MKKIICLVITMMISWGVFAQDPCLKLADQTKDHIGDDATFLTMYGAMIYESPYKNKKDSNNKTINKTANKDTTSQPGTSWNVVLSKDLHYRFTTGFPQYATGKVIVKLLRNNVTIETREIDPGTFSNIDFDCKETGEYKFITIFTVEKGKYCTCTVLSKILSEL